MTPLRIGSALLLLLAPALGQAATLIVDAAGSGDYTDIASAIAASSSGDVIDVMTGTYVQNRIDSEHGLTITSSTGGVVIQPAFDNYEDETYLVGTTTIFRFTADEVSPLVIDLTLSNLTLDGINLGGLLEVEADQTLRGSLTVQNCQIINGAGGATPGIRISHMDVVIEDSTVSNHHTDTGGGGHYYGSAIRLSNSALTMNRTVISNNSSSWSGAGLWLRGSDAVITSSTFSYNTSDQSACSGDCDGGAILVTDASSLDIRTSTLSHNGNTMDGGAIACIDSICTISQSEFAANTAESGGAIKGLGADLTLTGNVFIENIANSEGGAVFGLWCSANECSASSSTSSPTNLYATNNHFVGNEANTAGAVLSMKNDAGSKFEEVEIINNLFAYSTGAAEAVGFLASSSIVTQLFEYNHYYANAGGDSNLILHPTETTAVDPDLFKYVAGVFDSNSLAPNPTSPLIDAGDPSILDLDGSTSDIGAFGGTSPNLFIDADGDTFLAIDDCDDTDPDKYPGQSWYADTDGDGYGDENASPTLQCDQPIDHVLDNTDCDDSDLSINPDTPWYSDYDGDGYGSGGVGSGCSQFLADTVTNTDDCNDWDATINPETRWYADNDLDNYGDASDPGTVVCMFATPYYSQDNTDCDDGDTDENPDATWYPDADEDTYGDSSSSVLCERENSTDVLDNTDCDDNDADENPDAIWWPDTDGDTFGNQNSSNACERVDATDVLDNTDCDDNDVEQNPDVNWYTDNDGDTFGDPANAFNCLKNEGTDVTNDQDCDDNDETEYPAQEWHPDEDGDGYGDENTTSYCDRADPDDILDGSDCNDSDAEQNPDVTWYNDFDFDGYGDDSSANICSRTNIDMVSQGGDCDDDDPNQNPSVSWFADVDGDGYGDVLSASKCEKLPGYIADYTDCDDTDADRYPGAFWYADYDDDGYGDPNIASDCQPFDDSVPHSQNPDDCDDADPTANPSVFWYADVDGDTFGDPNTETQCLRNALTNVNNGDDCDDTQANTFPDAIEACDGIVNSCDYNDLPDSERDVDGDLYVECEYDVATWKGEISIVGGEDCDDNDAEEHPLARWYQDIDGDGFGTDITVNNCLRGHPTDSPTPGDCDDSRPEAAPGAKELCNGLIDDCNLTNLPADEVDEDDDGFAACSSAGEPWLSTPVLSDSDCDDEDPFIYPLAPEFCDGRDNDCDGLVDDQLVDVPWYQDIDGDGYGDSNTAVLACQSPGAGYSLRGGDCEDTNSTRHPGREETCDSLDNDCDGDIDEDAVDGDVYYPDSDNDSFGDMWSSILACEQPADTTTDSSDCDDTDPSINPNGEEICNQLDDDCDVRVDEEAIDAWLHNLDADRDGHGDPDSEPILICGATLDYVETSDDCDDQHPFTYPSAPELCDEMDNDCDDVIDNNVATLNWYPDIDGDRFGDENAAPVNDCSWPENHVTDNTDCNDLFDWANPDVTDEVYYDDVDQNCDGASDFDADLDGFEKYSVPNDCDDTDDTVYPGAPEISDNGIDEDCDGSDWVTILEDTGDTGDTGETGDTGDTGDTDVKPLPDPGCECSSSSALMASQSTMWLVLFSLLRRRRVTSSH